MTSPSGSICNNYMVGRQNSQLWACPMTGGNLKGKWLPVSGAELAGLTRCYWTYFHVSFADFSKWRLVLVDRDRQAWLKRAEKVGAISVCILQPRQSSPS